MAMSPHEVEKIAKTAAQEAVKETLVALGFDVSDPLAAQADQQFLRTMRVGTRNGIWIAFKTFIGVVVTAAAGWLWLAFHK